MPELEEIEFADRYGGQMPSLRHGCRGDCDATGFVPIYMTAGDVQARDLVQIDTVDEQRPEYVALWEAAEAKSPAGDGWHFVRCPDCGGTGRTQGLLPLLRQFFWFLRKQAEFARSHVFVRPYGTKRAQEALAWQKAHAPETVEESVEAPCPVKVPYGDRLDVPSPWLWNRRVAARVLAGKVR